MSDSRSYFAVDVSWEEEEFAGEIDWDQRGDSLLPEGDQPVCCRCLGPAGELPLRCWHTHGDTVLDEWVMCWPCVEQETAAGKSLEQLLRQLAKHSVQRHAQAGRAADVG